jgi:hypothetical protein
MIIEALTRRREAVLEKWQRLSAAAYPVETARFMKNRDVFANPAGFALSDAMDAVIDYLCNQPEGVRSEAADGGNRFGAGAGVADAGRENLDARLDTLVRLRAVQDLTPAAAVSFIFFLKGVLREEFFDMLLAPAAFKEFLAVESGIDDIALTVFDLYARCREKLFEVRARELESNHYRLLEKARITTKREPPPSHEPPPSIECL